LSNDITDILGSSFVNYPGNSIKVGVVCVAVIPYVMEKCYAIRPVDPDPSSSEHTRYQIVAESPPGLASEKQDKWRLPFKELNLDVDEDLLIVKVKRRPVVVLSRAIVDERKADPSRFQDSFWCVPSYTMIDNFGHPQLDNNIIEDVRAFSYRCCFPLPYDSYLHDQESMLRFDRMQPIPRHCLKATERRLSKEWRLYLQEWARFYITGRLGDDDSDKNPKSMATELKATRELLMEMLAEQRAKQKS